MPRMIQHSVVYAGKSVFQITTPAMLTAINVEDFRLNAKSAKRDIRARVTNSKLASGKSLQRVLILSDGNVGK